MPKNSALLARSPLFAVVFFGILLFLLYQISRLLMPFLSPLLWAAALTLALYPVYTRVLLLTRGREGISSGIMTMLTLVLVVGPAVAFLGVLAGQAFDLYEWISAMIESGRLAEFWSRFKITYADKLLNYPALAGVDVKGMAMKGLGDISSSLAGRIGDVLRNTLMFVIDIAIMLTALFFFFRDGRSFYQRAVELLPFTKEQRTSIEEKFADTFKAVINGVFLVALLQGAATGLGFVVFGIDYAAFWGVLAAGLGLLPVGGTALIWGPGALYLYLTGQTVSAILLALWGVLIVSMLDNFLKPIIIGRKTKINTFILFIAVLGGLELYGLLGVLFGPLVVTLLTVFVRIYQEEYAGAANGQGRAVGF